LLNHLLNPDNCEIESISSVFYTYFFLNQSQYLKLNDSHDGYIKRRWVGNEIHWAKRFFFYLYVTGKFANFNLWNVQSVFIYYYYYFELFWLQAVFELSNRFYFINWFLQSKSTFQFWNHEKLINLSSKSIFFLHIFKVFITFCTFSFTYQYHGAFQAW
jgi:hypothetical protein